MLEKLQISVPSSPIYDEPSFNSNLETECLFGEIFFAEKLILNWTYGYLATDKYYGWIQTKHLEKHLSSNYKIIVPRSIVLSKPNVKSESIFYLPMCSLINVQSIIGKWAKINYLKSDVLKIGYLPKSHIIKSTNKQNNWVKIALSLIKVPYKWGGRDTVAIDCSSLVQLICNTQRIFLPRNTSEQISFIKNNFKHLIIDIDNRQNMVKTIFFKKGCLVYWEGHVGILIDNKTIIHANAFHNNVSTESISTLVNRLFRQKLKIKLMCQLLN